MAHNNTRGKTTAAIQQFEHDAKHWNLCPDDFGKLKMIGEGGEGTVYRAKHKNSGLDVALKRIPYNECFDNEQESRIHCQLVHPNIVRMYGMFRDKNDNDDDDDAKLSTCWIILEYCPEGTMLQVMQTTRFASPKTREAFVSNKLCKILHAVQYMHDVHQLMHRDIKPANLLWKNGHEPVLADFGMCGKLKLKSSSESSSLSKEHTSNNHATCGSGPRNYEFIGTIPYMAPEVLALEPKYRAVAKNNEEQRGDGDDDKSGYSYKADCWSIGITTYELVTGMHPFPILLNDQPQYSLAVRRHVENLIINSNVSPHSIITFPDNVSQDAKNFILSLVQVDPKKRMSINDALAHPWIRRHVKQQHAAAAVAAVTSMSSKNQDKENKPTVKQQHPRAAPSKQSASNSGDDNNDDATAVKELQALLGGLDINTV